ERTLATERKHGQECELDQVWRDTVEHTRDDHDPPRFQEQTRRLEMVGQRVRIRRRRQGGQAIECDDGGREGEESNPQRRPHAVQHGGIPALEQQQATAADSEKPEQPARRKESRQAGDEQNPTEQSEAERESEDRPLTRLEGAIETEDAQSHKAEAHGRRDLKQKDREGHSTRRTAASTTSATSRKASRYARPA